MEQEEPEYIYALPRRRHEGDWPVVVMLVRQGVNMGDHGETITTAVAFDPATPIADVARAALTRKTWKGEREPITDAHLTVRLALPIDMEGVDPEAPF